MRQFLLILLMPVIIWGDANIKRENLDSVVPTPTLVEINQTFDDVAQSYSLPSTLLKAISYYQNHWDPLYSDYGRYGMMGLRSGNSIDSIRRGSSLTGFAELSALNNYKRNIEMSAAILRDLKDLAIDSGEIIQDIEDYYPILAQYYDLRESAQKYAKDMALETFIKIDEGFMMRRKGNDDLMIPGTKLDFSRLYTLLPPPPYKTIDSITSLNDIEFIKSPNYSSRKGTKIDQVVLHIMQGSMGGTISWFKNTASQASSHYVVSQKGEIVQMVALENKAWHAGTANRRSVGIEQEGWYDPDNDHIQNITDIEYRASAMLTRWLCDKYDIPKVHIEAYISPWKADQTKNKVPGIYGHRDISGKPLCPGWNFDFDYFMQLVLGDSFSKKEGSVTFITPLNNGVTTNPVVFKAHKSGDVVKVKYFADDTYLLGESTDDANYFEVSYSFSGVDRERPITVRGYDEDDKLIQEAVDMIEITPKNEGSGTIEFTTPTDGMASNPVVCEVATTGAIKKVVYYTDLSSATLYRLDTVNEAPFRMERNFNETGPRILYAFGYDENGVLLATDIQRVIVPTATSNMTTDPGNGTIQFTKPNTSSFDDNYVAIKLSAPSSVKVIKLFDRKALVGGDQDLLVTTLTAPFSTTRYFDDGDHTLMAYGYENDFSDTPLDTTQVTFTVGSEDDYAISCDYAPNHTTPVLMILLLLGAAVIIRKRYQL